VNHWFGSKEGLFAAATSIPVDPAALVDALAAGGPDGVGERIVRQFLTVWDTAGQGRLIALIRSVSSHEESARMLREFITKLVFGRLTERLGVDQPQLRAALCGSQIAGLGMVRYVLRLEPIASADHDLLAAAIGPTLQRYLTGPLTADE
ncbi:MAG TPA: TetR/AcrR family transcriptional regulator, partial [Pseudonocardiaceae bacterium]|nr:TetR/AcrR family transcriptional regulator [Pseudonocardiaceae bacterium]